MYVYVCVRQIFTIQDLTRSKSVAFLRISKIVFRCCILRLFSKSHLKCNQRAFFHSSFSSSIMRETKLWFTTNSTNHIFVLCKTVPKWRSMRFFLLSVLQSLLQSSCIIVSQLFVDAVAIPFGRYVNGIYAMLVSYIFRWVITIRNGILKYYSRSNDAFYTQNMDSSICRPVLFSIISLMWVIL